MGNEIANTIHNKFLMNHTSLHSTINPKSGIKINPKRHLSCLHDVTWIIGNFGACATGKVISLKYPRTHLVLRFVRNLRNTQPTLGEKCTTFLYLLVHRRINWAAGPLLTGSEAAIRSCRSDKIITLSYSLTLGVHFFSREFRQTSRCLAVSDGSFFLPTAFQFWMWCWRPAKTFQMCHFSQIRN